MSEATRQRAVALFRAGVAAANPENAVASAIAANPVPKCKGKTYVIAVGKAAVGMARATRSCLGPVAQTLIITNYENATEIDGAEVFASGHPVPDENGLRASVAVIELLQRAGKNDRVIALISGGGSALLPAPVVGVSLDEKAEVNRVLLGSGLDINEMNLVRQQISRLKGGGFARFAAPAKVSAFILSDVIGDDLRAIASGPTVAPIGTAAEARALLVAAGVWDLFPAAVQAYLMNRTDGAETPIDNVENHLIGSNSISVRAMADEAGDAVVRQSPLVGDVEAAAQTVLTTSGSGTTLFGGETTVLIKGNGMGGRNQELALRVAILAERAGWTDDWVFLSGGTDGRDGPTDAAGGLVDNGTLARIRAAGGSPQQLLANNDSYHALKLAGDLLMTGATGTNVADLQVMIRP